ncbi:beta-1,4-xylosidase [Astrocystis sublimbata]|nr:beta-1,4-xylosidase [Astrocystis sublimbata]
MPSIDIGAVEDLTHSRYALRLSDGKRLVLFRLPPIRPSETSADAKSHDWVYYAMEAECPHAGGPMADAQVDIEDASYIASCPWHAYDFNLETGESSFGVKACTYPVRLQNGRVLLSLDDEAVRLSALQAVSEQVKFKHGSRETTTGSLKYLSDDATLCDWCVHILNTADPEDKIELTSHLFSLFATREQSSTPMSLGAGSVAAPSQPLRQDLHEVKPGQMPAARKGGSLKSRQAMLHALANIEQWAIDLAIDICVRFATFQTTATADSASQQLPRTFYYDWLKVANDEAKHFSLLRCRLEELGSHFGALPVHHGVWESATRTAHDLRARISVIALVHEARGLDINPLTIEKFRAAKDMESVEVMTIIHNDEITHVTTGHRWLSWICEQEGTDPVQVFRSNVRKHFSGGLKGPFNVAGRQQAGMDSSYYEDLAGLPGEKTEVIAGG